MTVEPPYGYLLLRDECSDEGCQVWFRTLFYDLGDAWDKYDCDHSWVSAMDKARMFNIVVMCKCCGTRSFKACQFDVDQLFLSVNDTEADWWSYCTEVKETHRIVAIMEVTPVDR